jgi:drug/metabolite transporter (DMT)-like permease
MTEESQRLSPVALLLLASLALFWGVNWPAIKIVLVVVPPFTFRTICLAIGGGGLLLLAWRAGQPLSVPRGERAALVAVAFLNITCWHMFSAYGIAFMNPGRAAIIAFTMPLWAMLLGAALGSERVTGPRVVALALGMGGLAALMAPEFERAGGVPLGGVLMLGSAISWAAGTLLMKRRRWSLPVAAMSGWQLLIGGIPTLAGALLFDHWPDFGRFDLGGWMALAYTVTIPMIYCYWAWFRVVPMAPATVTGIGTMMVPVVGVFTTALVLGEPAGFPEFLALGLILPALAIVVLGPAPKAAP